MRDAPKPGPAVDVEKSVHVYRGLGPRLIVDALPRYAGLEDAKDA